MGRTRWFTVVGWIAGATIITLLVLRLADRFGMDRPPVPWPVVPLLLVLAGWLAVRGWKVRQYLDGKRPGLTGLQAARTAAFAKAAVLGGSLLTGWYVGVFLTGVEAAAATGNWARSVLAVASFVSASALWIVGLVVERQCDLPAQPGRESSDAGSSPV